MLHRTTDLHSIGCVSVLKDHSLLDLLVVSLQFLNVGAESHHLLVDGTQLVQMVLQNDIMITKLLSVHPSMCTCSSLRMRT